MHVDWRTVATIPVYVGVGVAGDFLLSAGMRSMPALSGVHPGEMTRFFRHILCSPLVLGGIALQAVNFGLLLALFSWEDLSVVVPSRAASYLVVAVVARLVLHEAVSPQRWAGVILVTCGVALILTTTRRKERPEVERPGPPARAEGKHRAPGPQSGFPGG